MTATAEGSAATSVHVPLGPCGYDILIGDGLIAEAGRHVARVAPRARVAVVTDETVAPLHAASVRAGLAAAGIDTVEIVVPAGEATKSLAHLERVLDALLEARIERGDVVAALGGGVVGDLAGFAAAVLRRGIRFVQVPTTLLAQVDSSVGGKTGVNTRHGKNLVGAFHQPILVLADAGVLDTLPQRQFRAGYAEMAKYGLLGDAAFFATLEADWRDVFAGGPARADAIAVACRGKARIVAADERETGERALLNLGHTFAHALEAATGFGERLLHGEAVAIGMRLAFAFSARLGLVGDDATHRVAAHLRAVGLPTTIAEIPGTPPAADELMTHIAQDKKVKRGSLTFILVRDIGQAFVAEDVSGADVRDFLQSDIRQP